MAAAILLGSAVTTNAELARADTARLQALLEQGVPVIDVRTEAEWKHTGIVPGAHRITFFDAKGNYDFRAWLDELHQVVKPDQPFVLICQTGMRSRSIGHVLSKKLGYKAVYDAHEGVQGWLERKLPTTRQW